MNNMFASFTFSEENKGAYRELCQKFLRSEGVFQCQHQNWLKTADPTEYTNVKERAKETPVQEVYHEKIIHTPKKRKTERTPSLSTESDLNGTLQSGPLDFKSMQTALIDNVKSSTKYKFSSLQTEHQQMICESGIPAPSDNDLVEVCKKCERLDETLIKTIFHLPDKLSTSMSDALSEFVQWHSSLVVTHALIPLLQYCSNMQEQHKDALAQLIQDCSPHLVTQMLKAMSTRKHISDTDIQIFHLLCEKCDHQSEASHMAVLDYLGKASESHKSSQKLAHCLLFVVKKMGPSIQDQHSLQHVISNHNSHMKRVIEAQLKKVTRKR